MRKLFVLFALCFLAVTTQGTVWAQKDATKKPGTAKKMPARDPKTGKFVKSGDKMGGTTKTGKKLPPRDPKTGRFVKAGDKMAAPAGKKGGKKMPARDPKTGKFIKSKS